MAVEEKEVEWRLVPYKFLPKFRPLYRPIHSRPYQPRFRNRWEGLVNKRRQQHHKYTREELERLKPGVLARWQERHERYVREAKEHEETMRKRHTRRKEVDSNGRKC